MAGRRPSSSDAGSTGLDVTARVRRLCEDLVATLDELRHIDMSRTALRLCQTRRAGHHGVQASMTPLRFRDGADTLVRRGTPWRIHPCPHDSLGRRHLYLLSLYVPRFLDLTADEKVAVVLHELWHASPAFDGDLRRFGKGRTRFHGGGCEQYHHQMRKLAKRRLANGDLHETHPWLACDFAAMKRRYGRVFGTKLPTPRLFRADRLPREDADAA
jgi:hypothetical protein